MNQYYVYEWIRLDNNEPFYVGKGKGERCFTEKKEIVIVFKNMQHSLKNIYIIYLDKMSWDRLVSNLIRL